MPDIRRKAISCRNSSGFHGHLGYIPKASLYLREEKRTKDRAQLPGRKRRNGMI